MTLEQRHRRWVFLKLPESKARRYEIEAYQWYAHIPAVCILYLFFRDIWDAIATLYLAIVSIYALASTAGAKKEAATPTVEETDVEEVKEP